ncbi:MAG TPA: hypothetical protein VK524_03725 [Polyangiaceae bacterium]|nr:hypothetical protein [Polyangiaceae bacterium]
MNRPRKFLIAVSFGALLASCGSSSNNANSPQTALQNTHQRLQGRWLLVDFRPDEPLEPMLHALLAAQFNTLTLTVGPDQMRAVGTGVDTQRRYRLQWATGDQAAVKVLDEGGIAYDVAFSFERNALAFSSRTSPWRGAGRLRRLEWVEPIY